MTGSALIGVTGGIGSGKSSVCRLFALWGAPVYDCDARAKELMDESAAMQSAIVDLLGFGACPSGRPDRRYIASKVFSDPALLEALDKIVHPAVGRDFSQWALRQTAPYVIMESAILFESGFDSMAHSIVAVSAPEDVRIARVATRDGVSREDVLRRMTNQIDDAVRQSRAGYIINNDGGHSLVEQVACVHDIFIDQYGWH